MDLTTVQRLADRWADWREIENVITKRTFYNLHNWGKREYDDLWCKKAEPCLGLNNGYYSGREAVEGYFDAVEELIRIKAETALKLYPDKIEAKTAEQARGAGCVPTDSLTTPVFELSEDGETAKALWYMLGVDTSLKGCGPDSSWQLGRVGADFIREDGAWKIWHLLCVQDVSCPFGENWGSFGKKPDQAGFEAIAAFKFPEPNVPAQVYESYHRGRKVSPVPRIPEPYVTFADTFSYGV